MPPLTAECDACTQNVTISTWRGGLRPRPSGLGLGRFEIRLDHGPRLPARGHGDDLERYACAAPLENPGLNELEIVATHQLEAAGKVGLDPAVEILEPLRQQPAPLAQALVDGDHVVVAETLDHHEQHFIVFAWRAFEAKACSSL